MKKLSRWILSKVEEGIWRPLKESRGSVKFSHLFFVDDLLLFDEAGVDQIECIIKVLRSFCAALGQKINFYNSLVYFSPNIFEPVTLSVSNSMGIPMTSELGYYLGHHILHLGRNKEAHDLLL